ncbi:MAG: hypothetical protein PHO70_05840 [Candidatus Omnitrophica bacterium]|nr:hypothetical protein [Candidatus Omnitrophota bacterium]
MNNKSKYEEKCFSRKAIAMKGRRYKKKEWYGKTLPCAADNIAENCFLAITLLTAIKLKL